MFVVFNAYDLMMIFFLVFLEGILSIDNALVLAVTVKHLPPEQQKKALSYGIWSAMIFRFIALFCLSQLMKLTWLKLVGALYLLWIGIHHFLFPSVGRQPMKTSAIGFWRTILVVELLDIAFSIDSILAAVGVSDNLVVVFIGGILGIIMMRFSAGIFVRILERFKRLENLAYWLVIAIGLKLGIQSFLGASG